MQVGEASAVARDWLEQYRQKMPGIAGAFLHGSIAWLPDRAEMAAGSDVDVIVVIDGPPPAVKLGKIPVGDLLLDVTELSVDEVKTAEAVLENYHLAGSLRAPTILFDPTGKLTALHGEVARQFARRQWVIRRCEDARSRVLRNLASIDPRAPFHDQVTSWLFAAGVTTQVLLTAGLKNPTVRRRYEAVRDLLAEYDRLGDHGRLLELVGCRELTPERVARRLDELALAFDEASAAVRTPFFFASDLSQAARPIAIDGGRAMIARGSHREAVFWIAATYARCMKVFAADAPELTARFAPAFRGLVADLGIVSADDVVARGDHVRAFLPELWSLAEAIIAENPAITD